MEEVQKLGKTYDTLGNQKDQFHTFILCLVCQLMPTDTVTNGIDLMLRDLHMNHQCVHVYECVCVSVCACVVLCECVLCARVCACV